MGIQSDTPDKGGIDSGAQSSAGSWPIGLTIKRHFTNVQVDVFDSIEWEIRPWTPLTSKRGFGEEILEVEAPVFWSKTASDVAASHFMAGNYGDMPVERSIRDMVLRICETIVQFGREGGYFRSEDDALSFLEELKYLLVYQKLGFGSAIWMNVGKARQPSCGQFVIAKEKAVVEEGLERKGSEERAQLARGTWLTQVSRHFLTDEFMRIVDAGATGETSGSSEEMKHFDSLIESLGNRPHSTKVNFISHFHDLRHCAVTNMRKAGVPEHVIMSITGHKTTHMLRRYDKVDREDRDLATERVREFLALRAQAERKTA